MGQFDVFVNPIERARRAYPYVVVLQANGVDTGRERLVAPIAPRAQMRASAGRVTPRVSIAGVEHVVLTPNMVAVRASELREARGHLHASRDAIVAALDYLFLGV